MAIACVTATMPCRRRPGEKMQEKKEEEDGKRKFPCRLKGINSWIRLPAGQIETRRRQKSALPVSPPPPRKNRHLVSLSRLLIVWIDSKEKILLPFPSSSLSTMRPSPPPCHPIPLRRRRRLLKLINLAEGDLDREKAPLDFICRRRTWYFLSPSSALLFLDVPLARVQKSLTVAETPMPSAQILQKDPLSVPSIRAAVKESPFPSPALCYCCRKKRGRGAIVRISLSFFVPPNFDLSHTAPFFASPPLFFSFLYGCSFSAAA